MAKLVQVNSPVEINGETYPAGKEIRISDELFIELGDKVSEVKQKPKPESK